MSSFVIGGMNGIGLAKEGEGQSSSLWTTVSYCSIFLLSCEEELT